MTDFLHSKQMRKTAKTLTEKKKKNANCTSASSKNYA